MKIIQNIALMLSALLISALIAETFLFVAAGLRGGDSGAGPYKYDDLYVSKSPVAVFDPVRGYRRLGDENRIIRVVKDTLVFDQVYRMNNEQFISAIDYRHRREEGRVFRFAVFGDSFTDADYLPNPWVDRLNARFSELDIPGAERLEFYSFSVNGAGLSNWHSILFNEVAPAYDLDGIIIASYGDDFARQFSILHYEENDSFTGRFNTRPESEAEFRADFRPKLSPHYAKVWSEGEMDALVASLQTGWKWRTPELQWRLIPFVSQQLRVLQTAETPANPQRNAVGANQERLFSIAEIEASYGQDQISQLWEMITFSKEREIPLIMAAVPSRDGLISWLSREGQRLTSHQTEIKSIATHFDLMYFDGYAAFSGLEPDAIQREHWLTYDGHWNQSGSDRFAAAIGDYLELHFGRESAVTFQEVD